jgi:hypothetical protein
MLHHRRVGEVQKQLQEVKDGHRDWVPGIRIQNKGCVEEISTTARDWVGREVLLLLVRFPTF